MGIRNRDKQTKPKITALKPVLVCLGFELEYKSVEDCKAWFEKMNIAYEADKLEYDEDQQVYDYKLSKYYENEITTFEHVFDNKENGEDGKVTLIGGLYMWQDKPLDKKK